MSKIISVYAKAKAKYGKDTILIFRTDYDECAAYLEDSQIVSDVCGIKREIERQSMYFVIYSTRFPESEVEMRINQLMDAGYGVYYSQVKDKRGNYILSID